MSGRHTQTTQADEELTISFSFPFQAYVRKPDSRIPNVVQTQLFKDQVKSVQQIFKNNLDEKGKLCPLVLCVNVSSPVCLSRIYEYFRL